MYRVINPNMVNMQARTITLPMNVYLELCGRHGRDEEADEFLMYTYKVRRCPRNRAHDWTECPYAHRGEKARRRDPRKFPYQGIVCPDFKNGDCKKGQNCEYAHGIFEFWLHPSRFRTRVCESGVLCPRRVCFFAHTPEQLRPEGVHHCSRCGQRGHANGVPLAAAETETTLAAAPGISSLAGGAEGSIARVRGAVEEEYDDFPHLGWVSDLVNW